LPARRRLPEPDGRLVPRRGQRLAVGGVGQREDRLPAFARRQAGEATRGQGVPPAPLRRDLACTQEGPQRQQNGPPPPCTHDPLPGPCRGGVRQRPRSARSNSSPPAQVMALCIPSSGKSFLTKRTEPSASARWRPALNSPPSRGRGFFGE